MHVHFVNENVGGHTTMHLAIRAALAGRPDIRATFFDVPAPTLPRKLFAAPVPGLDKLDLDLHPLRSQLGASAVVRRHLRREGVDADVLHLYTHNAGLLSADLLRARATVVSLDATNAQNAYRLPQREPTRWTPKALVPTKALERRVYRAATLVVAKSAWAAGSLREDYGVPEDRIRVIPLGIEVPDVEWRGSEGLPRLTFIGRSMARKGGWLLLDVWRRRFRDRAVLTLVTLDDVPEEPGLEVRRDVRPGDGQILDILSRTDAFVFPTNLDTFGYAALEAMAAGVPVVANRTAALPEIVDEGVTGLLVEPKAADELGDAIEALLADPDRRRAMGAAGRLRVQERFDAAATTAALLDVLDEARRLGPR